MPRTTRSAMGGSGTVAPPPHMEPTDENFERDNNTLRAYREMRRRVLEGEMPPGRQYLEQELAQMLGMSRTPVREALIRLADERLVEVRPRHGVRVLPLSIEDIGEIYELLATLEALAAHRLATSGATAEQLSVLTAADDRMTAAVGAGDRTNWFAADRTFHSTIVMVSGSARLQETVQGLYAQSNWARLQTIPRYTITPQSCDDHAAIIAAIAAGDARSARVHMYEHRLRGGAVLVDLLKTRGSDHG